MNEKPNYYSVMTANVRYDNRLTDSEKLLYSEISSLTQKNGECWASNQYFSKLYGVTPQAISKRINKLKKYGYLEVEYIYAKNSKNIEKRIIKICSQNLSTVVDTYQPEIKGGINSRLIGYQPEIKENNTSINNTSINNKEIYKEIIKYLNMRTGKRFKLTDSVQSQLNARVGEGFELKDFKDVIDKKCVEWMDTEWQKYLQPSTLFGTKFQNYLNQEVVRKKSPNPYMAMQFDDKGNLI